MRLHPTSHAFQQALLDSLPYRGHGMPEVEDYLWGVRYPAGSARTPETDSATFEQIAADFVAWMAREDEKWEAQQIAEDAARRAATPTEAGE